MLLPLSAHIIVLQADSTVQSLPAKWVWIAGAGVGLFLLVAIGVWLAQRGSNSQKQEGRPRPYGAGRGGPSNDSLSAEYDDALQRGAFSEAAAFARRLRDPRRYARALEQAGDTDRAISAWIDAGDSKRAAELLESKEQWSKAGWITRSLANINAR